MERKLLSAAAARELCGGVTDMTFWRWLNNPSLDFPKPVKISNRNYWREAELLAWLDARAEARGAA